MSKWILLLVCGLLLMPLNVSAQDEPGALVNLDHLRFLTQPVTIDGREMALVHIYSEYPEYEWVDAAGEGLSAVDDVARAAVVYLWEYERSGATELLDLARRCLEFVLYMQAEDGEFYNFVTDAEGTINRTGGTSYKSLGWWAMRGLWALGEGVRVFDSIDAEYADRLAEAYLRTEAALAGTMGNYGEMLTVHGFDVPAWIPGSEPAVASIGLLGLAAYYEARPNDATADTITKIADGVAQYQLGDHSTYPFGMHPVAANAPGFWHDWGAHMTHALVVAGMALERQDWIESAADEANSFLLRQLVFERFRHIGVVPSRLEQIAYGTNMLVQAYAALYRATSDEKYAQYAGIASSWYFGNNMAETQVYFPETGVVYDGINGPVSWRVNRNSGAESTIEGLMSLIAIADMPQALDLLHVEAVSSTPWIILEAESGDRVVGTPTYFSTTWTGEGYVSGGRYVSIGEGQRMRLQFEVEQEDDYLLYVAHVHQSMGSSANVIQRAAEPPTIDGSDEDWSPEVIRIESNTAQQFLRGAGLWQGAEVDSHAVRLTWDDDNLYIFADVRDPQHEQPFTLSNAGQGDNLWLYFTSSDQASRLSAKATLAQTPDGAQVWDWLHAGFFEGARLGFEPFEGGYRYEAALPWSSLGVDAPQAGMQIGFEAGRGVGGNTFMDLTGRDPDVAANLLKLMLVEPGMDAEASTVPQVGLEVRFGDEDAVTIPQTVSPDSDHFWLDVVLPDPIHLTLGEYTIRYGYAGEETANPGSAKVDAFYLQPVVARRVWQTPDGRAITLTYDTVTGEATWTEA